MIAGFCNWLLFARCDLSVCQGWLVPTMSSNSRKLVGEAAIFYAASGTGRITWWAWMPQDTDGSVRSEGERWDQLMVGTGVWYLHSSDTYVLYMTETFFGWYGAVTLAWKLDRTNRSPINFIGKSAFFHGELFMNEKEEEKKLDTWRAFCKTPTTIKPANGQWFEKWSSLIRISPGTDCRRLAPSTNQGEIVQV